MIDPLKRSPDLLGGIGVKVTHVGHELDNTAIEELTPHPESEKMTTSATYPYGSLRSPKYIHRCNTFPYVAPRAHVPLQVGEKIRRNQDQGSLSGCFCSEKRAWALGMTHRLSLDESCKPEILSDQGFCPL